MRRKIDIQRTLPPRRRKKRAVTVERLSEPTEAAPAAEKTAAPSDRPKPRKSADDRYFDPKKHANWLA